MLANQKMVARDGYEVMLFPLEYMYMSQDEGGDYSHAGTLQIDFLGWGANGRILRCPYYAPCTCKCVGTTDPNANNRIYESTKRVHLADGTLSFVTFEVAHDNSPPHNVGDIVKQGDLLGRTGTAGYVTGDHLHFQTAKGKYAGWEQVPPNNNWQLKNEMHIYDACYVNDTVIVEGYGHNWKTYQGGITPSRYKSHKFKWALYSRKLRQKRNTL